MSTEKYSGLSDAEVLQARQKHGSNELEPKKKESFLVKILHVFAEPMFLLLLAAASIYFILGEVTDGLIMLGFVFFISGIEFIQEQKTDKALEVLNTLSALNVKVVRGGQITTIDSRDVVVGDLVMLEEGDKVPADGEIIESQNLGLNESALTGESAVVYKKPKAQDDPNHFKNYFCYSGTDVTNGSALIKVTAVGPKTEYGKIGHALGNITKEKTPLEKQIKKLIIVCTIISLTFFIAVIIINFINNASLPIGDRLIQSILSGITVAMATIPEEIPVVLTVFLAMGAWSLAKKNTLTRNMKAVETLGAVTVLCTDKTGTLTENKMSVQEIFSANPQNLVRAAALACPKTPFDPMEIAIQKYCFAHDIAPKIYDQKLVHEYVFTHEDKMMGQVWCIDNQNFLAVKGAVENVLPLCHPKDAAKIQQQVADFSAKGFRVLAVASASLAQNLPKNLKDVKLHFDGLIALVDPPRQGVKKSLKSCYEAGVRVIMITGDNGATAQGIAKQIGLKNSSQIITGAELEEMSDTELREKVKTTNIFARVYPTHKMRIVEALQRNHEVVAMTGDGVNDAPALKKAEIGIAMGERGTNVAKEAADMILMDDNFSTIVDAIKNGRTIYANIRKALAYILVIHIPIAFTALFVPLFDLPALLLPIHIVLLELIIDPTSSIIFQRLQPDDDIMKTKPRVASEPIVTKDIVLKSITQGIFIFLATFISYYLFLRSGANQSLATTFAFTVLVLSNIFVVYVLQSSKIAFKNLVHSLRDRVSLAIQLVILLVLGLIIYLPALNNLVNTTPLTPLQLLAAIAIALLATLPFDLLKRR